MMLKETLGVIAKAQRIELESMELGVKREKLKSIATRGSHAIILSGIRRCGKSTLLRQIIKNSEKFYYFNFEDPRAVQFDISDFEKLDSVFQEEFGKGGIYFFDEIQNVEGWERFVRKMQDLGKKFIITGSNASLLSKELGTKLTGRHITYELFPFSYAEMLALTSQKPSLKSFEEYMKSGGFPDFLKQGKTQILQELMNDIITRDIIARYGLRDSKAVKEIATFIISNAGKEFSFNGIAKHFNLGSANTAASYISYFEDSYLIFTIPKFDYSYRKQVASPKKAYSIDTGLSNANSASFSEDLGRALESIVFLALRRKYNNIFYFKGERECDFIVKEKEKIVEAIQVCLKLDEENKEREISGLKEAMEKLKIKNGIIITLNQEDELGSIKAIPAWKWLLE